MDLNIQSWFRNFQRTYNYGELNLSYWNGDFTSMYAKLQNGFFCSNLDVILDSGISIREFLGDIIKQNYGYGRKTFLSNINIIKILYNGRLVLVFIDLKDDFILLCCLIKSGFHARVIRLSQMSEFYEDWVEVGYCLGKSGHRLIHQEGDGSKTKGVR